MFWLYSCLNLVIGRWTSLCLFVCLRVFFFTQVSECLAQKQISIIRGKAKKAAMKIYEISSFFKLKKKSFMIQFQHYLVLNFEFLLCVCSLKSFLAKYSFLGWISQGCPYVLENILCIMLCWGILPFWRLHSDSYRAWYKNWLLQDGRSRTRNL